MIYSHKPQRSGRSISSNTNNPPQDPPPPHEEIEIPIVIEKQPEIILEIPDILIEDSTPPVPEICIEEEPIVTKVPQTSWFRRLVSKIKRFFRR